MKLAIMQPYFFPYIGYYQLINCVNNFLIYDNIQYTKKGWINRNRILHGDKEFIITLPIKKDSDFLHICDRNIAHDFNRKKILNKIHGAYVKAPYFKNVFPVIEDTILYENLNLFKYLQNSILNICKYLKIDTKILISSDVDIDHNLKGQDKVIELCKNLKSKTYINAIGGKELYSANIFKENKIDLKFIKSKDIEYKQFTDNFHPWLSIIDIMMFNSSDTISNYLNKYTLETNK